MIDRAPSKMNPAQMTVQAAQGWLELGAAQAAWEELEALEPNARIDPAVLHQQARVLVALGRLQEAKETARCLATSAPAWRLALLEDPVLDPIWL